MFKRSFISVLSAVSVLALAGCAASGSTSEPQDEAATPFVPESTSTVSGSGTTPSSSALAKPSPTQQTSSPTPAPRSGADADVKFVRAVQSADGTWTFYVTVEHPDTGWDDYADGWDVLTQQGDVIKPDPDSPFTRLLLHPHVDEQPFTRSQRGIAIPEGVDKVIVRAHDIVDGFGGQEVLVDLNELTGARISKLNSINKVGIDYAA
jgi:hypothetical protein